MKIFRQNKVVISQSENIILRTIRALEILKPQLPQKGSLILIKPNIVVPMNKNSGAITRPEIVEAIIQFLNEKNYQIVVGEGSAEQTTNEAFLKGGYLYLVKKYKIKLVDLNKGPFIKITTGQKDWPEFEISKLAKEADYLISAAVLKEHFFGLTLTIKNLMGCLKPKGLPTKSYMHPKNDEEIWSKRMVLLYQALKPNLAIIDGTTAMFGSHLTGRLEKMDLTIVGEDALEVDLVGAKILGRERVKYLEEIKKSL